MSAPSRRVLDLADSADRAIAALPGVRKTERGSFRVDGKVFARVGAEDDAVVYGFKLGRTAARAASARHDFVRPMVFGGMGAKGWVELSLCRKAHVATLLRLLGESRALYPA